MKDNNIDINVTDINEYNKNLRIFENILYLKYISFIFEIYIYLKTLFYIDKWNSKKAYLLLLE